MNVVPSDHENNAKASRSLFNSLREKNVSISNLVPNDDSEDSQSALIFSLEQQLIELKVDLATSKSSEDHLKLELSRLRVAFERLQGEHERLRREFDQNNFQNAGAEERTSINESGKRTIENVIQSVDEENFDFDSREVSNTLRVRTRDGGITTNRKIINRPPSCASGIAFLHGNMSVGSLNSVSFSQLLGATASPSNSSLYGHGHPNFSLHQHLGRDAPEPLVEAPNNNLPNAPSCASGIAFLQGNFSTLAVSTLTAHMDQFNHSVVTTTRPSSNRRRNSRNQASGYVHLRHSMYVEPSRYQSNEGWDEAGVVRPSNNASLFQQYLRNSS